MSQNTRNKHGDSQGNSGQRSNTNQERNGYEGFEGMNYEQIRQPYNPRHRNNDTDDINGSGGNDERRDEL